MEYIDFLYLVGSNFLKLKCLIDSFGSYKHTAFTSQDVN